MTTVHRPRRSALYLPASNARAIEKARSLPADVIILDLEDAVAPDAKVSAREAAIEAVAAGDFGSKEVAIRANGLDNLARVCKGKVCVALDLDRQIHTAGAVFLGFEGEFGQLNLVDASGVAPAVDEEVHVLENPWQFDGHYRISSR